MMITSWHDGSRHVRRHQRVVQPLINRKVTPLCLLGIPKKWRCGSKRGAGSVWRRGRAFIGGTSPREGQSPEQRRIACHSAGAGASESLKAALLVLRRLRVSVSKRDGRAGKGTVSGKPIDGATHAERLAWHVRYVMPDCFRDEPCAATAKVDARVRSCGPHGISVRARSRTSRGVSPRQMARIYGGVGGDTGAIESNDNSIVATKKRKTWHGAQRPRRSTKT